MKKLLIFIVSIPVILIAALAGAYILQDLIIFKPTRSASGEAYAEALKIPEHELQLETYPLVRGRVKRSSKDSRTYESKTFIYGDYNIDVLQYFQPALENLSSTTVYAVSYPGFGNSAGTPDSKRLFQHQLAIFDTYTEASNTPCFLIGYGIGANVATFIAAQRPDKVYGVISIAPALGLREYVEYKLKAGKVFDFFQDRWGVKKYLLSMNEIIPLYCIASESDEVIPFQLSVDYCTSWRGKVESLQLKNNLHSQMFTPEVVSQINKFMIKHIERR